MGLTNYSSGAIYISISDGSIVRTFKTEQQGTQPRVNKKGVTVYELRFKDVTGIITEIKDREHDFGKDLQVHIQDGEEKYILSMPFSSRYSSSFMKAVPNLNINKVVRIMPWSMEDKNDNTKKVTGVTLYQDLSGKGWDKIFPAFTKDNPNGLPQMIQVKVKGQLVWDDTEMMAFLFKAVTEHLSKQPQQEVKAKSAKKDNAEYITEPITEDDLPF